MPVTVVPTENSTFAFCLHAGVRGFPTGVYNVQITYSPAEAIVSLSMFYVVRMSWHNEFDEMTGRRQMTVLEDIQIELAHFEVGYDGVVHPLRTVIIVDQIPYDEAFTKTRLSERLLHIRAAYSAMDAIITRAGKRAFQQEILAGRPNVGATPPSADKP